MMLPTLISRTRRNHGLEHATLNILARKYPGRLFAGHSDMKGFWILGEISTEELTAVTLEAIKLKKKKKKHLAIHRNCGTNLLTSGLLAGLAGAAGMSGAGRSYREKLERIPLITMLGMLALVLARYLGPYLQKHVTTSGSPGTLQVRQVLAQPIQHTTVHRIQTLG